MEPSIVVPTPTIKLKLKNFKTCVKCGTSDTPLWRNGPEGPKSMCNACGIRWKRANTPKNKKKLLPGDEYHKIPALSPYSLQTYEVREKSFPEEDESDNSDHLYSHAEESEEAFDYYDEVQAPQGSPRGTTPVASDSKEETHPSLETLEQNSQLGSSDSKAKESELGKEKQTFVHFEGLTEDTRKRKEPPKKILFSKRPHKHQKIHRIHSDTFLKKQAEEEKMEGNPLFFQVAFYELQRVSDQMLYEHKIEQLNEEIEKLKTELKKRTRMVWDLHSFATKCQSKKPLRSNGVSTDKAISLPPNPYDIMDAQIAPVNPSSVGALPYQMGVNEIVLSGTSNMVPVHAPKVVTDR